MTIGVAATLSGSILCSSCIGSFSMFNKVTSWNKSLTDNKFVNELVFIALNIIPVYEFAIGIDYLILNTIEFWTGDNPMAAAIETENGTVTVARHGKGYTISNEKGEELNLLFDTETSTWNMVANGESHKLVQIVDSETAVVYLNGEPQRVELNETGIASLRQSVEEAGLVALK